jgi:hypothetical protein
MQPQLITCKNCGHQFYGKYCNECGEKLFTHHDKSVAHLLEEGLHFATHFEGKFFTTVKTIFTAPGRFASDYCEGIRKKYFKPLSFFLLLVVIYLLFPIANGLNANLGAHVHAEFYGAYAKEKAISLMKSKHWSEAYLFDHFHTTSEKVSKVLLILLIPVMAVWTWLLTRRKKTYFDHFIFSTELNSFMILWGFLVMPLITRLILRIIALFSHRDFFNDAAIGIILSASMLAYTFLAFKKFFQYKTGRALLFSFLYTVFYVLVIHYVYQFVLFWISIHLVH